jgi:dephospho-CoA kinase
MLSVGLTGGIGTGKTTVGRMFVALGCHLIDADAIVHKLIEPPGDVYQSIVAEFGPKILNEHGRINRTVLGEIVFNHPQARTRLNALVHPAVIQRQRDWLQELRSTNPDAIGIVDAALMIEVGSYKDFDRVVVVVCSREEQVRRLRARSGLSDEQIESRIRAQMPIEEKVRFANYVIDNSGSLDDTQKQVERVFTSLVDASGERGRN